MITTLVIGNRLKFGIMHSRGQLIFPIGNNKYKREKKVLLSPDVVNGDLNCDLVSENPRVDALHFFCATVNATQLIDKPTRLAQFTDVIIVSDPAHEIPNNNRSRYFPK